MSWLDDFSNFVKNAATGDLTSQQKQDANDQLASSIRAAGGSEQDVTDAIAQQNGYIEDHLGGTAEASLSSTGSSLTKYGVIVIVILVLVVILAHEF